MARMDHKVQYKGPHTAQRRPQRPIEGPPTAARRQRGPTQRTTVHI